jgi:glycosyltransferase involved in cell wall biosynthesis
MQTSPRTGSLEAQPEAFERHSRTPLIVFSHLRWGFVFQRPQHLLTRLARQYDVMFIEEPVFADGEPALMSATRQEGVEVLTPRTNVVVPGFNDEQMPVLRRLVAEFVASRGLSDPLVWLYTPIALPLVADLDPLALVYDCMDDLASFKFAPPQLVEREAALMRMADVVLTGGPSLYEARKGRHPNLHCLPSAVDARHFSPANLDLDAPEGAAARALHAGLAHPRLGFFGVIDERLDLELVVGIAERRPDWQIVMVGPVVKIDPATLPRRPNIRWLGMQGYEALPHLTAQWDVCLLPFALNEATRFISPTKTLEYMACGKPSVSTAIRDVVEPYGHVVPIRADAEGFVQACDEILARSASEQDEHRFALAAILAKTSWDATAAAMGELIAQAEAAREAQELPAVADIATELARATASLPTGAAAH